ncbi:mitochondrial carrier homolog 2-like [Rhopalosiphum maidis]|uniref:mitochondrial carrier homolog 2-like n=1 Tax=Rhopalosiphum maidis TaxID=43146 RepID=UPI000EFE0C50|nr:mitochondrial carrier homolog 2-like [Rhopalosiphum maidis]XP_026804226.1 mitochondrial carrier homolog 2-like [Rhopalosiphum maidis]
MDSDTDNRSEENGDAPKHNLIGKCVMKTITHPLDYARFLVQIGHEPMAPYRHRSIFGEERLFLPNLIIYAKYIYSVDGFKGMYIGLGPKIMGICIEHFSSSLMSDYIQIDKNQNINNKDSDLEVWTKCAIKTSKEMICTATSIILSHPLHIVSMRMMAQFVGYEHRYTLVLQSILLINREEGVKGLFAGIIPRLFAGLGTVILVNVAKQVFSRYLFDPSPMTLNIADFAASYLANAATYSFNVVTACTAINNCGLAAGMPPDMPVFGNWLECMKYLYRTDQLNRGSSTWFRRVPLSNSKLLKLL